MVTVKKLTNNISDLIFQSQLAKQPPTAAGRPVVSKTFFSFYKIDKWDIEFANRMMKY